MDKRYHNGWDRDNFYYHRKDPTPWRPIDEPIPLKNAVKEFVRTLVITVVLAIAVSYAITVKAEVLAQTDNNLGGKMAITDVKCASSAGHIAYSTNPKGETLLGCWVHDNSFVHILWSGSTNPNSYGLNVWVVVKKQTPSI